MHFNLFILPYLFSLSLPPPFLSLAPPSLPLPSLPPYPPPTQSEFINMYSAYMNEFKVAMQTLAKYEQSSQQFVQDIRSCQQSAVCEGLSLAAYLLTPVQRLPRYELLLKVRVLFCVGVVIGQCGVRCAGYYVIVLWQEHWPVALRELPQHISITGYCITNMYFGYVSRPCLSLLTLLPLTTHTSPPHPSLIRSS